MRLTKFIIFTFWTLIMFLNRLSAQTFQEVADSLVNLLEHIEEPRERVDMLNEISYAYRRIGAQEVYDYGKKAYNLAQEIGYTKGAAVARKNQGISHHKKNSPVDTIKYYYLEAIRLAESCNEYYTQAACNNNIALLHNQNQELYTSIQFYLKGIKIFDEHFEEELRLKALMLANLSESYQYMGDNELALYYVKRAFDIAERKGYRSIISMYADDYGKTLTDLKRFDKARGIFDQGLKMNEELQDDMSKTMLLNHYANLEIILGNLESATKLAEDAFQLSKDGKVYGSLFYSRLCKARIAYARGNYDEGIQQCKKVINQGDKVERRSYQQWAREILSKCYEKNGDLANSLKVLKAYQTIRDSIMENEKVTLTLEIDSRYRSKEKEQAISFLEKEKTMQSKYIKGLTTFSIFSLLAVLFILYLFYKTLQKEKIIKQKNGELKKYIDYNLQLESFTHIASHDIRTPLRTIISFSQLLKRKTKQKLNEEEAEYLDFVIQGTKEISMLTNDLLEYSRINGANVRLELVDINEVVQNVIALNKVYLEEKDAKIAVDIQMPIVKADKIKLMQVLQNLILNAVKFHHPDKKPELTICSKEDKNQTLFEVRDNGIGIEKSYFEKIFLVFKRLNKKEIYEGSGIGLSICKKVIEMHRGKIWVESQIGQGSSFFFTIPKV